MSIGTSWDVHGSETSATDDWGFVFPTGCVTTTRLRLNRLGVVSTQSQSSNPCLYELKVYGCGATGPVTLEQLEAKLDAIEPAVSGLEAKLDAIEPAVSGLEAKLDALDSTLAGKASQGSVDAIEAKLDAGGGCPTTCEILLELLPFLPGNGQLPTSHPCFVTTLTPTTVGGGRIEMGGRRGGTVDPGD